MKHADLMLHCGAGHITREELALVQTPQATSTWQPIPHMRLLETVERQLAPTGLHVVSEAHGLNKTRTQYFGLLQVAEAAAVESDMAWVIGVRNSHDKKFPAGLCAGNQVFVCDNLAFSGEIKVTRKHTSLILHDLPKLIGSAITRLTDVWKRQQDQLTQYKTIDLVDRDVNDLLIKSLDAGVFCGERIAPILHDWREPAHEEFKPRNLWSFFNAVTGNLKGNLHALPAKTQSLYAVCDSFTNN